jgi:membrane-bound ClpP family serine protease
VVEGKITDSQGAAIDATVTLRSIDGTQSSVQEVRAGKDGTFSIREVPDGEYSLTVSRSGRYDKTQRVSVKGDLLAANKLGIVLDSTTFYRISVFIRAGVVGYLLAFGALILMTNYFLAPLPSRELTAVGLLTFAVATFIPAVKAEWLQMMVAVGLGLPVAAVICYFGSLAAADRKAEFDADELQKREEREYDELLLKKLVGREGKALTDLRPFGTIEVARDTIEARLDHGFLNTGSAVVVKRIDGRVPVVSALVLED